VAALYAAAPFIVALGIHPESAEPGVVTAALALRPDHLQQNGFVHAGVQATLADHTAGAAGYTLVAPGESVLTVEFKLNLLRPATGDRLRARAEVLRQGRRLVVVESSVFTKGNAPLLVAKATVTLAVVRRESGTAVE
jgi:uncharacterized protein (TIGR00369 family)